MIDTEALSVEAATALREQVTYINDLRNERKEINQRIAEAVLEERRLRRITNAFKPRERRATDNGESE